VIVRCEHFLSLEAYAALDRAVVRANFGWPDIVRFMQGQGWAIWNCGGLSWVFTMVDTDDEIEVLLAGGREARKCVGPWEAAMLAHPAHRGMTLRIDGRKGWGRLLPHWERRDDVLYLKVQSGGEKEVHYDTDEQADLLNAN
jgi:hypothetical protein